MPLSGKKKKTKELLQIKWGQRDMITKCNPGLDHWKIFTIKGKLGKLEKSEGELCIKQ